MNHEYDLAKPLASALKASAPYVGIPIPGHAPLIFPRLLLVRALKGVRPVNIEVLAPPGVADRWLVVDGVANESANRHLRVKHHMKVRAIPRCELKRDWTAHGKAFTAWVDAARKPKKQLPAGKHTKAIAKLERQLAQLGSRPRIFNPATASGGGWSDGNRETWLRWRAQRKLRGRVGALANAAKASRELYAALRGLGLTRVRTFSDLNTAEKRRLAPAPDEEDRRHGWQHEGTYLDFAEPRNLWRFQPELAGRPRLWGDDYFDGTRWGAHRYAVVLEWSQERQELLSQIAAIRTMTEAA